MSFTGHFTGKLGQTQGKGQDADSPHPFRQRAERPYRRAKPDKEFATRGAHLLFGPPVTPEATRLAWSSVASRSMSGPQLRARGAGRRR